MDLKYHIFTLKVSKRGKIKKELDECYKFTHPSKL